MKIYLSEISEPGVTESEVSFPITPQEIKLRFGAEFLTFNVLDIGTVKIPKGNEPDAISWEGILPGKARQSMSIVTEWEDPIAIRDRLDTWKRLGTTLYLLVTEAFIWRKVFISEFEPVHSGGFGDITYSILLTEFVDLEISTTDETTKATSTTRTSQNKAKTHTVRKGETLWIIAKKELGNGGRYMEIYNLNKKSAGGVLTSPSGVSPGQVLKLP